MKSQTRANGLFPNAGESYKAMNGKQTYAIHWKSTLSGRIGTGTTLFAKQEAERLAKELNEKYPDIDHEAIVPAPASAEPGPAEPAQELSG